jgi:hypothetical protein
MFSYIPASALLRAAREGFSGQVASVAAAYAPPPCFIEEYKEPKASDSKLVQDAILGGNLPVLRALLDKNRPTPPTLLTALEFAVRASGSGADRAAAAVCQGDDELLHLLTEHQAIPEDDTWFERMAQTIECLVEHIYWQGTHHDMMDALVIVSSVPNLESAVESLLGYLKLRRLIVSQDTVARAVHYPNLAEHVDGLEMWNSTMRASGDLSMFGAAYGNPGAVAYALRAGFGIDPRAALLASRGGTPGCGRVAEMLLAHDQAHSED